MDKDRVKEELEACKRRLKDMMVVIERRLERVSMWTESDKAASMFEHELINARRALEDTEQVIRKLD